MEVGGGDRARGKEKEGGHQALIVLAPDPSVFLHRLETRVSVGLCVTDWLMSSEAPSLLSCL